MATEKTLLIAEIEKACLDVNFYLLEVQGLEFTWYYEEIKFVGQSKYEELNGEKVAKVYVNINGQLETEFVGYSKTEDGIADLILDFVNNKY